MFPNLQDQYIKEKIKERLRAALKIQDKATQSPDAFHEATNP